MPTFVLVGHCGPDRFLLKSSVDRAVAGSSVAFVNDDKSLKVHLDGDAVLLVNRVLDGRFAAKDGIELIGQVARADDAAAAILISNLPDAQAEAEAAGALPGFGKGDLYDEDTAQKLRAAAGE